MSDRSCRGAGAATVSRFVIAALLALVAAVVASRLTRRRAAAPAPAQEWNVPRQLDRRDFVRPDAPWLVAVFSSSTCEVCAAVWTRAQVVESGEVAVQNVEATGDKRLHERYRIDAVPLVLIVDGEGAVRRHFLGPVNATDLWGALAELR